MNKTVGGVLVFIGGLASAGAYAGVETRSFGVFSFQYSGTGEAYPFTPGGTESHTVDVIRLRSQIVAPEPGRFGIEASSFWGGSSSAIYNYQATYTNDTADALALKFEFAIPDGGFLESSVAVGGAVASFAQLNLSVEGYGSGSTPSTLWQSTASVTNGGVTTTGVDIYGDLTSGSPAGSLGPARPSYVEVEGGSYMLDLGVLAPGGWYTVSYSANATAGDSGALLGDPRPAVVRFSDPLTATLPLLSGHSTTPPIPEPATYGLMALGLALTLTLAKRRKDAAQA